MTQNPSDDLLRDILRKSRVFALVGVSPNPVRPSHFVGRYLGLKGYKWTCRVFVPPQVLV